MNAVAYLFIPLFNLYWAFVVLVGWVNRMNRRAPAPTGESAPISRLQPLIALLTLPPCAVAFLLAVPLGLSLAAVSSVAWLATAHAMLFEPQTPSTPSPDEALRAYSGQVNGRIAIGVVVGTVAAYAVQWCAPALIIDWLHLSSGGSADEWLAWWSDNAVNLAGFITSTALGLAATAVLLAVRPKAPWWAVLAVLCGTTWLAAAGTDGWRADDFPEWAAATAIFLLFEYGGLTIALRLFKPRWLAVPLTALLTGLLAGPIARGLVAGSVPLDLPQWLDSLSPSGAELIGTLFFIALLIGLHRWFGSALSIQTSSASP